MSREDDARVAEILGWTNIRELIKGSGEYYGHEPGKHWISMPHFTTDAGDDYKVLEFVRDLDKTTHEQFCAYELELDGVIASHKYYIGPLGYIVGDYSRALLALKDKGLI